MSILNCVFSHWQVAFMLICALDENCIVLELSSLFHDVGSCQRVYTISLERMMPSGIHCNYFLFTQHCG
jgi:hypothetical protein